MPPLCVRCTPLKDPPMVPLPVKDEVHARRRRCVGSVGQGAGGAPCPCAVPLPDGRGIVARSRGSPVSLGALPLGVRP